MKTNTFLVFAAAFAAAIHSTNAQLIINGSFETPDTPTYIWIDAGQNTITPWVVGFHHVELGDAVGNGFITGAAFEGVQFLDLHGRLTQAFATTPGLLYTVTFAYTDNYWHSARSSTTASARVRLFDGLGDRLNQTITHTGAVAGNYHWTVFTAQFTALQNTTSLEFTPLTTVEDGLPGGIMLDAVQVFANPQLIINGGFETPDTPTYMYIYAGQNTLAPWVVGPNPVEVGDAVGNGFITGAAFEGVQMLDLHGRLTQTFATTPGSLYTVTFAYTDHPVEPAKQGLASARVRLFDGLGNRLNQTFTHTGAVSNDFKWTVFNGQFTAVTNKTSLEFTPLTTVPSGLPGGILLDAVQVTLALRATLVLQGSGATLNWTGGVPPYRVQRATDLTSGEWIDVLTNAVPPVTLTLEHQAEFYRIVGH